MSKKTPKNFGDFGNGNEVVRVSGVILDTPRDAPWTIRFRQEAVAEDGAGKKLDIRLSSPRALRVKYEDVKNRSFTYDGITATVEQIAGLISAAADAFRDEGA